jgi:glycosyltransferase involved in cell wall biosynthesis
LSQRIPCGPTRPEPFGARTGTFQARDRGPPLKTFVTEYDLDRPVRALWGLAGYEQGIILVRKDGEPIDLLWLHHDPRRSGISAAEIEDQIDERIGIVPATGTPFASTRPGSPEPASTISVVVCTRDRPRSLSGCLASIAQLDPAPREVIVIDNASRTEETREVVARSGFRYVRENRPGLDWARNRGAAEATQDIVAYVDDDVRVDRGWLQGVARGFLSPDVGAVTGLVLPEEMETRPQLLFEIYGGMSKGMEPRRFERDLLSPRALIRAQDLGVGANMAFRRSVLEALGGFDTALDVGTPSGGAGDLDMFQRVVLSGRALSYEPRALAWHRHRRDIEGLRRQLNANGCAFGVYLIKNWKERRVGRLPLSTYVLFLWFPWLAGRIVIRLFGRHRLPLGLLWAELRGALYSPRAYVRTYRQDAEVRRRFAE